MECNSSHNGSYYLMQEEILKEGFWQFLRQLSDQQLLPTIGKLIYIGCASWFCFIYCPGTLQHLVSIITGI
jgi:hypothetical protein